ncbi:MAG: alpha/beta fold hydrolase [Myxococcota bacterium]
MAELKPRDCWLDGRLHWLEWGPTYGSAALLVHGITGNAHNWDALAAIAARTHRIAALDLRGHGESAWAELDAYEHLDYLADLLDVIDQLGPPVSLIGHSIGGHVCLFLAALRPDLVSSLVVVDVEAFAPREQPEMLRRSGARSHPLFDDLDAVARRIQERQPRISGRLARAKALHDTLLQPDGSRVYRFDRGVLRGVTCPDARPYLPRIRCPVLLVRGEDSPVLRAAAAREMAEAMRNASLVEIPAAGHWPQLESSEAFTLAVTTFLEGSATR